MNHHGKTNKAQKVQRRFTDEDSTYTMCCPANGDPLELKQQNC